RCSANWPKICLLIVGPAFEGSTTIWTLCSAGIATEHTATIASPHNNVFNRIDTPTHGRTNLRGDYGRRLQLRASRKLASTDSKTAMAGIIPALIASSIRLSGGLHSR